MSNLPKLITQVGFTYGKIIGKAFMQAGRQAYKNTQYKPDAVSTDSSADEGKGSTSSTAGIDRTTNMRLAEARLILNVKEDAPWDKVQAQYDHLFLQNSPPAPPPLDPDAPPPAKPAKKAAAPTGTLHSFYLQSKVVRALERLEAEKALAEGETLEGEEEPTRVKEGEEVVKKEGEEVKSSPEGKEEVKPKGDEPKGP